MAPFDYNPQDYHRRWKLGVLHRGYLGDIRVELFGVLSVATFKNLVLHDLIGGEGHEYVASFYVHLALDQYLPYKSS